MAKPLLVASSGLPGSSKTSNCTSHHRKRSSTLVPSSGFLSLLASVVSATTVHGSPAPPPFLCPSIPLEAVVEPVIRKRTPKPTRVPPNSNTPPAKRRHRHLPDRYDKAPDGIWRRVGSYTLYGSTMPPSPPSCTGVCPPTNKSIDDQVQSGGQNSTIPSTPSYDIKDSLPPGWNPTAKPYAGRTGLILAMSLVLALFICFFIVACLLRKRIRKKRNDIEAKARRIRSRELAAEKEKKAKQRVWARATARWIRHGRANRLSSRLSHAHQPFDDSLSHLARPSSLKPSTRSSPQSSTISIPNQRRDEVEIITDLQDPVPPAITLGPTPTSPPAYQHGLPPIIVSTSPTDDSTGECAGPSGFDCSHRPPCSLSNSLLSPATDAETSEFFAPTPHVAHVATDDKSLLARLAELASSPPPDDSADPNQTPEATQVSAPAWHDEDIEDVDCNQPNNLLIDESACSLSPMFPPPPSKERLAATEFYSYPFTFHEAESGILESEPSAPPFEQDSSGALEGTLVPSAPPLLDDNGHFIPESAASAPEWESGEPIERENASGQDHDRIPSEGTSALVSLPSSSNPQPPFTASATLALPGYQP